MEYEKMPRINYIVGREDKYLINEFQTHEINGVTLMSQGYRYVGNDTEKWCQIGTFEEIRIKHIMRSHAQNYYILNGERFELEDNWGINTTNN